MVAFFVLRNLLGGFVVIDPVTVDQTQLPAAVVIFKTTEGFEGTVAVVVELPARDGAPLRHNRPDNREIMLLDLVVVLDD